MARACCQFELTLREALLLGVDPISPTVSRRSAESARGPPTPRAGLEPTAVSAAAAYGGRSGDWRTGCSFALCGDGAVSTDAVPGLTAWRGADAVLTSRPCDLLSLVLPRQLVVCPAPSTARSLPGNVPDWEGVGVGRCTALQGIAMNK